jgi:hypothetical protein
MILRRAGMVLALVTACAVAQQKEPTISPSPFGADQKVIYNDFLADYTKDFPGTLNVADTTTGLQLMGEQHPACLKDFPKLSTVDTHRFSSDFFAPLIKVRLVNPSLHKKRDPGEAIRRGESVDDAVKAGFAAGIFTLSEIVFNPTRDRATFTYSFVCGSLCGNGGTVIYHHVSGKWVQERNTCGSWIS